MSSHPRLTRVAVAGLVGLAACSVAGDSGPTAIKAPSSARFALGSSAGTPTKGQLQVCKDRTSNVAGVFTATLTQFVAVGFTPPATPSGTASSTPITLQPGECAVIAEDNGGDGIASDVVLTETSADFQSATLTAINAVYQSADVIDAPVPVGKTGTYRINQYHGDVVVYLNTQDAPPPPPTAVCDFITFGRLVTTVNGKKVVISGNAGGNKPGGGILSEFHIEVNGVDNHVADVATYGPITSGGALFGLTNSRITTGTAKNGAAVELRLWDGGEPGKNTDKVYVKINGSEIFGPDGKFIDQGNMQFHSNCRGPKL
jgi:hypothetical protein